MSVVLHKAVPSISNPATIFTRLQMLVGFWQAPLCKCIGILHDVLGFRRGRGSSQFDWKNRYPYAE
eukprot:2920984-Amphidinium_carterae.1